MKQKRRILILLAMILLAGQMPVYSDTVITISADQPGAPIAKNMWGIFFKDINFGADGRLYAELVKNRSFEFDDPMKIVPKPANPFNVPGAKFTYLFEPYSMTILELDVE